jgi:transposase
MYRSIKTRQTRFVNNKALIGTVDISKDTLMVYARTPSGEEIRPFKVANNYEGLMLFWGNIKLYQKRYSLEEVIIGFEPTGIYSEPLKNFMRDKAVKLVQVNPMHTKRVKDLTDNTPASTDKKDPRVIADIIQLGHYLSVITPTGPAAELRSLSHARDRQLTERTRLLNRLETLVFKIFPEFIHVVKDLSTKTAGYLLRHYPRPEDIREVPLEQLIKEIKGVSRGQVKEERLEQLKAASEVSLGTKEGRAGILLEIGHILNQLEQIEEFIKDLESKMKEELSRIDYAKRLLSIKGIGVIILGGIIGEVGDFRCYRKQSEVVKLAGLNIYEISSGRYMGKRHISRHGRWLLKKLLYFATLNVVRKGGIKHHEYQGLINRGKPKVVALIIIARKLLSTMFAMVRDGTEYQGGDKTNLKTEKIPA